MPLDPFALGRTSSHWSVLGTDDFAGGSPSLDIALAEMYVLRAARWLRRCLSPACYPRPIPPASCPFLSVPPLRHVVLPC